MWGDTQELGDLAVLLYLLAWETLTAEWSLPLDLCPKDKLFESAGLTCCA